MASAFFGLQPVLEASAAISRGNLEGTVRQQEHVQDAIRR